MDLRYLVDSGAKLAPPEERLGRDVDHSESHLPVEAIDQRQPETTGILAGAMARVCGVPGSRRRQRERERARLGERREGRQQQGQLIHSREAVIERVEGERRPWRCRSEEQGGEGDDRNILLRAPWPFSSPFLLVLSSFYFSVLFQILL